MSSMILESVLYSQKNIANPIYLVNKQFGNAFAPLIVERKELSGQYCRFSERDTEGGFYLHDKNIFVLAKMLSETYVYARSVDFTNFSSEEKEQVMTLFDISQMRPKHLINVNFSEYFMFNTSILENLIINQNNTTQEVVFKNLKKLVLSLGKNISKFYLQGIFGSISIGTKSDDCLKKVFEKVKFCNNLTLDFSLVKTSKNKLTIDDKNYDLSFVHDSLILESLSSFSTKNVILNKNLKSIFFYSTFYKLIDMDCVFDIDDILVVLEGSKIKIDIRSNSIKLKITGESLTLINCKGKKIDLIFNKKHITDFCDEDILIL